MMYNTSNISSGLILDQEVQQVRKDIGQEAKKEGVYCS